MDNNMKIKVIIEDGVVSEVLGTKDLASQDLDIEIIMQDQDNSDREKVQEYIDTCYQDPALAAIPYKQADYEEK